MYRRLTVILLAATATLALAALPRPLPDIQIPLPGGKTVRVQQYKGKVMVAMLFSTQCAECIASIDLLNKAQKNFGPRGFQAVAAAVNVDAPDEIKNFVDRYRPAYPTGHLGQADLLKFTDLKKGERPFVPIFIFIDKHQMIRFQYLGNDAIMKQQEKATMAIIDSLLKAQ
jgi:peroxiredoxin